MRNVQVEIENNKRSAGVEGDEGGEGGGEAEVVRCRWWPRGPRTFCTCRLATLRVY